MYTHNALENNTLERYLTIGVIGVALLGFSHYIFKRSKKQQESNKDITPLPPKDDR